MSKFLTAALVAALLTLSISNAQAKPTKSDCVAISKAQYNQAQKLLGASQFTIDRVLGASCQLSGYGNGLSAYGYKLNYDAKHWLVIVYQDGKVYKSKVLPLGMGLREG